MTVIASWSVEDEPPVLVEDAMDHTGPDFVRQATLYNFESKLGWVTRTEDLLRVLKG